LEPSRANLAQSRSLFHGRLLNERPVAIGTPVAVDEARRFAMPSRVLGIVIATWLPTLALMLPIGRFHTANALVAGLAASVLVAFSLVSDRARVAAAVIGAWVAFTPFVFSSTLIELTLAGCWGVTMFASLTGPFSQAPDRIVVRRLQRPRTSSEDRAVFEAAA
jgi:hypothetical protein